MNDIAAAQIAADITETWQLTASKRIWMQTLTPMTDIDAARKAYTQLRRNHEGRDMSIPMFTAEYRRHRPPPTPTEYPDCEHCGDGWTTIEYEKNGRTTRGVKPCHCPKGQDVERTWRAANQPRTTP